MQETEKDNNLIHDFCSLPQASLDVLAANLGLRMSRAELAFCAKHYPTKNGKDISIQALRMLDALACPDRIKASKIAVKEMLTDSPAVAEAYRDAIDKLHALGYTFKRPITLQDMADLPTKYLQVLGGKQAVKPAAAQAEYADALVLLCPGEPSEMPFEDQVRELTTDVHVSTSVAASSILHTLLGISRGAVINIARLPEQMQQAERLALPVQGQLLALSQSALPALQQKAEEAGVGCCYFGVADHAGALVVKNGTEQLFSLDFNYLKALCFIRSYSLRLHRQVVASADMQADPFFSALLCAADACSSAVAAGHDPSLLSLQAHLRATAHKPLSRSYGDALTALLGLYRFSMETMISVQTDVTFDAEQIELTVQAGESEASTTVSDTLQGQGYVYLLRPTCDACGLPDLGEQRKMLAYLHAQIRQGNVLCARALCGKTPREVLDHAADECKVILNKDHVQTVEGVYPGAVLVEAKKRLSGDLIAVCAGLIVKNA